MMFEVIDSHWMVMQNKINTVSTKTYHGNDSLE